jgi:hypothetical protein
MNSTAPVLEKTQPTTEELPIDRPRKSGVIVRRGDREAAMALLDSLLVEGDQIEERETLEFLKKAINEHRASVGARLMFPDEQNHSS